MKFDPHEPPFYGQDCLFHQRFIKRASLIIRKWFFLQESHSKYTIFFNRRLGYALETAAQDTDLLFIEVG